MEDFRTIGRRVSNWGRWGESDERGTVNLITPDRLVAAAQLIRFDLAGISVSAGSACSSGSMKPSHVLAAMGWSEAASREVVRVSFGRTTREADVTRFTQAWRQIARETRSFAA